MEEVAAFMCPSLQSRMWPSRKVVDMSMKNDKAADSVTKATGHGASEAARTRISCFGHVVSTPWLLCFLIVVYSLHTSRPDDDKDRARKASDLMREWVIRVAPESIALNVPSSSGQWILHDGRIVSDDDHDLRELLFSGRGGPHYDVLDWLCELSRLLTQPPGRRANGQAKCFSNRARRKASQLAESLMINLAHHLDIWAQDQKRASVHLLMHTHERGQKRARHQHPGLKAAISMKKRARGAAMDMAADSAAGFGVAGVAEVMEKTCAVYYNVVKQSLQSAATLEVCMDGSRFRSRDTEVVQVYTYDGSLPEEARIRPTPPTGHGGESRGFAANMPPLRHRELRWRDAAAGSMLSAEDRQQFEASGFKAKPGQATKDQAHMLNRILAHAGKTLAWAIAPALDRQTARGERMWCSVRLRWFRREHAVTERQEQCWVPEIPDEYFMKDWAQIPLLLVTVDQAGPGWGACHFLCSLGRPGQPQLQQAGRPHTAPKSKRPRPCRRIAIP